IFFILVAFSAFFSSSETAFTSVNRIRLKNEAEKGDKQSQQALKLTEQYDSVLSTLLIGNNIVNIGASAIATLLFISWFPVYGATLATIVTTIIILIFAEITPKNIAKEKSEYVSKRVAPFIQFLMFVFRPFLWLLQKWKVTIDRVFKLEGEEV